MATLDLKRLRTLHNALYRDNAGERNAAATIYYTYLRDCQLHPEDIQFSVGNDLIARNQAVIDRLLTETRRLHNENLFLRRHTAPQILQDAAKGRDVQYRWFDLEDLARHKFRNDQGDLPRHWRNLLGKATGCTVYQMQRWERGIVEIPDTVFEQLQSLPDFADPTVVTKPPKPPKAPKAHRKGPKRSEYGWPEPVLRAAVTSYLRGGDRATILHATRSAAGPDAQITSDMISGKIDNGRVPAFLRAGVRPTGEPIDWPELWLIGATLFIRVKTGKKIQRGWRTPALQALGLNKNIQPPTDLNLGTTQPQIDALRLRYVQHNLGQDKMKPIAELYRPILDVLTAAGSRGLTRTEIKAKLRSDPYRRYSELQRSLRIFDTGLRRDDQVVYVTRQFADQHPEAWRLEVEKYGQEMEAA